MDLTQIMWMLVDFVAPALGTAALAATLGKVFWRRDLAKLGWFALWVRTATMGLLALVAGLVWTGQDGRMASYAAMVTAIALTLWWSAFKRLAG